MNNQINNEPVGNKQLGLNRRKIKFRYKLIDEHRCHYLTVLDNQTGKKFQIHALELANNKTMVNEFCGWDARHIGVIAGYASFDPIIPLDQC